MEKRPRISTAYTRGDSDSRAGLRHYTKACILYAYNTVTDRKDG